MLNQVQYRHDSILIKKDGKPVSALVDAQLFDRIRRFKDRFDTLSQHIADADANVPQEEGLNEIDAIVSGTRHSQFRLCRKSALSLITTVLFPEQPIPTRYREKLFLPGEAEV